MPKLPALPTALRTPSPTMAWVWAGALVTVAFLIRLSLQPVLGGGLAYSTFLPVVILIAYAVGRWPAIVSALVCANLALFCFVEPTFTLKLPADAMTGYLFFLVS